MPRLREIVSTENLTPNRFRSNVGARGQAAELGLGKLGGEIQNLGNTLTKRHQRKEDARIAAESARAQAELTVEMNERRRTMDPNDPDFENNTSRFMEEVVSPRLDALRDLATTSQSRTRVQGLEADINARMFQRASSDQEAVASIGAKEDMEDLLDAHTVTIANDPTAFRSVLSDFERDTNAMVINGSLRSEDRITAVNAFKRDSAITAANAWIVRDIDAAEALIDTGGIYDEDITGSDKLKLLATIATRRKQNLADWDKAKGKIVQQHLIEISSQVNAGVEVPMSVVEDFHDEVGYATSTEFELAKSIIRGGKQVDDARTRFGLEAIAGDLTEEEMLLRVSLAYEAGLLSGPTGSALIAKNKTDRATSETTPRKVMLKMHKTVIDTMPAELDLVGGGQALARGVGDIEQFIADNPNVTLTEAIDEANRLITRDVALDFSDTRIATGRPYLFTGNENPTEEDLDNSSRQLIEDRENGRITSDNIYIGEMERIDRHRLLLAAEAAAARIPGQEER